MPRQDALKDVKDKVPALARRPESVAGDKRDRGWDESNRAIPVRIQQADTERLTALAEQLQVSRDAVTRALLELALDVVEAGQVAFETYERTRETRDRLGRLRITTRRFVRASWAAERNEHSGE